MMLLVNIPWAAIIWVLPFLTVLAPSERYYAKGVRQPKKLTDSARQKGKQVRRWLPKRKIVLVADSTYAALGLLDSLVRLSEPVYMVTRLRLDAALYEPAPPRGPHQVRRPAKKGPKLPNSPSEKCHGEQNMGTSELDQGQPVLVFFVPAHPNSAPLSQPTDSSLDHPATGGMTLFLRYVWLFFQGLVPAAMMVDMGDIVSFCNSLIHIIIVIALVGTEMLFDFLRVWALKGQVFNQVISRPLVMLIGSSHLQSQWGTLLIDQNVDFCQVTIRNAHKVVVVLKTFSFPA